MRIRRLLARMGLVAAVRAAGAGSGPIRRRWRLSFPPDTPGGDVSAGCQPDDIIGHLIGRQLARDVGIEAE